jgi:hypothetical protein
VEPPLSYADASAFRRDRLLAALALIAGSA